MGHYQITSRQSEFVRLYVEYGDAHRAALESGYAESSADRGMTFLLTRPDIALEIARAARPRLARALPLAISTLEYLVEHAQSEKVRADCAKAILDRAGLVPPKPQNDRNASELPLHEMSIDALRAHADKLERERADSAKPINAAPASPADAHEFGGVDPAKPIGPTSTPGETPANDDPDGLFGDIT